MMPAFRGALSPEQLQRVMDYIRTMCTDAAWPRGELNLPCPLVTGKAYPEDEWVVAASLPIDGSGRVTTGLVSAETWAKDNRLLPGGLRRGGRRGERAAVRGAARSDHDFGPGGDRVRYSVAVGRADGPFTVAARPRFQPIGYRWAENLASYDAFEIRRFVRYYREMAAASAITVAKAAVVVAN